MTCHKLDGLKHLLSHSSECHKPLNPNVSRVGSSGRLWGMVCSMLLSELPAVSANLGAPRHVDASVQSLPPTTQQHSFLCVTVSTIPSFMHVDKGPVIQHHNWVIYKIPLKLHLPPNPVLEMLSGIFFSPLCLHACYFDIWKPLSSPTKPHSYVIFFVTVTDSIFRKVPTLITFITLS